MNDSVYRLETQQTKSSHMFNETIHNDKEKKKRNFPKITLNTEIFKEKLNDGTIHTLLSGRYNNNDYKPIQDNTTTSFGMNKENSTSNKINYLKTKNNHFLCNQWTNPQYLTSLNSTNCNTNFNLTSSKFNKTHSNFLKENQTFNLTSIKPFNRHGEIDSLKKKNVEDVKTNNLDLLKELQNTDYKKKFISLEKFYHKIKDNKEVFNKEIDEIKNLYFTYKNVDINEKFTESEKREIFDRFEIDLKNVPIQEKIIKNYYDEVKAENKITRTIEEDKDLVSYNKSHFSSIYNAIKKVNLNKEIYGSVMGLWNHMLIDKYSDIISKEEETKYKLSLMPMVRESKIDRMNKRGNIDEYDNSSHNNLKGLISRDIILTKELIFFVKNTNYKKNRPICRSHISSVVLNNVLYIYGGLNGSRYNDMWKLELSEGKLIIKIDSIKWSEVQILSKPPLKRSGHTMVTLGNEIFIYGGVINDLDNPNEDIVIFDSSKI